ncbi:sigma-54-dependent Fis family transcriptional regulator [Garciella nitratireducens]|uniref:sigma-54-dependent Fis family transcriptional regulator n=1 Tax=Garciella nitratireducens TaxID=218205 RepID=UPI000DEA146F|nr:PAS domain S-box-containing protein [Garciella nitratireducens]
MKAKEVMMPNPIALSVTETLKEAAEIFSKQDIDKIFIVNDIEQVVGAFSKKNLFQAIQEDRSLETNIIEFMDTQIRCIYEEEDVSTIFEKSQEVFPIINYKDKLIGVLYKQELLKAYNKKLTIITEHLNTILNSTNNGIIAIDKDLSISFFNKAAGELLEVDYNKILGKNIYEIVPNSRLPYVLENRVKEIGKIMHYNEKKILTNRTPIIYEHQVIGAIAVFQDRTDYNQLLAKLEEEKNANNILNTILEMAYDGIVVIDKEGYITMMSKAYTKFLGVEHKEVIGKHVTEIIQNTRLHIVLKTGRAEVADLQKINGNYMIASRIPIIKDGEVTGAVGKILFRDIQDLNLLHKRITKMDQELAHYKREWKNANRAYYSFSDIIGESEAIQRAKSLAERASYSMSNVLLLGESGTGKEIFAHAIHQKSKRCQFPFVKVNCAAIPRELLESELFGYEGGSFTGAQKKGKIGKFQAADGGTIFLDEIGDMPLQMQAKLLRVLQEKEIEKIGSTNTQKIDIRVIAATNQDLEDLVKKGKFRSDLFYRLNVLTIQIPALRERKGDISILVQYFLDKICNEMGKYIENISEEAMVCLQNYNWPGNIRELENVLERAVNIMDKELIIQTKHLPKEIVNNGQIESDQVISLRERIEEAEKQAIIQALKATRGNKSKAARLLEISRACLYEKMRKYQL